MKSIKNLFNTPKKAVLSSICALGLVAVLGIGTAYAASGIAEGSSIGAENAKNFAFADAGVDPVTAEYVRAKFDFEKGTFVYEVEFTSGGIEYEYLIKASDGSVVRRETETQKRTVTAGAEAGTEAEQIGLDAAKEKALADAGAAADAVTFTQARSEEDDGVPIYEIEFYTADYAFEYEIHAVTGKIISRSKETRMTADMGAQAGTPPAEQGTDAVQDPENASSPPAESGIPAQNDTIGVSAAKSKALADAGLSEGEVTFTRAKLDYEDGVPVYDVEFYSSDHEYEYEIDAKTGNVLERSKEALEHLSEGSQAGNAYIGTDKAKAAALSHAGLRAEEVTFTKVKLETDDGLAVYELEFFRDRMEYEYTINAVSGTIVEFESDWDD